MDFYVLDTLAALYLQWSWSVVGLAGTVTIGAVPETSGDKPLGDADESDEAYSGIMMGKEAGVLLSMIRIHRSDSCPKVQDPRP